MHILASTVHNNIADDNVRKTVFINSLTLPPLILGRVNMPLKCCMNITRDTLKYGLRDMLNLP